MDAYEHTYMLRSLICHATYQLVVLFFVIFMVGDVCPGSTGNVCTTPVLYTGYGGLRSGRPADFDKEFLGTHSQKYSSIEQLKSLLDLR